MPRNGSGTYSLPSGNPVVTGSTISSTTHNNTMSDVATALSASLAKDGQTTPSANLPMGGYKHTNVASATARTEYCTAGQAQDNTFDWLSSVSGTDTITATAPISMSTYASGQCFRFTSAGANTGAATININAIGAKSIVKHGGVALVAGDIPAGATVEIVYDGTNFELIGAMAPTISTLATLTPAASKVPYFTGSSAASLLDFKDEDDMASNSATAIPSQQSVKAYVDANLVPSLANPGVSIIHGGGLNVPASATRYCATQGSLFETAVSGNCTWRIPAGCGVRNLQVSLNGSISAGTLTLTAMQWNEDTALSVAMSSGTTGSDTTHTLYYPVEGDFVVKAVSSGLSPTTLDLSWSVEVFDLEAGHGVYTLNWRSGYAGSIALVGDKGGANGIASSIGNDIPLPAACVVTDFTTDGTTWRKNRGTPLSASSVSTIAAEFAQGDTIVANSSATLDSAIMAEVLAKNPAVDAPPCFLVFAYWSNHPAGTTYYYSGYNTPISLTESECHFPVPVACTVKNLFGRLVTAITAGSTCTFTLRKNGADTGLTVTVSNSDGTNAVSDTTHTVTFAAGDMLSMKVVTAGAATASFPVCAVQVLQ